MNTAAMLALHPAWPASARLGDGWSAPEIRAPREIAIDDGATGDLEAIGVRLLKRPGPGNRLLLDEETPRQTLTLDLAYARNNTIVLARNATIKGGIKMLGHGHLLAVAGAEERVVLSVTCTMRGERCLMLLGSGFSSNGTALLADGVEQSVLIGDDSMFSSEIAVRTSDSHAVIAIAEQQQVNLPASVCIGPHVWIGQEALVLKGVSIGAGAIVAARSLVTSHVPPRTLVGGAPARALRNGVTWTRDRQPAAATIADTIARWGS